MPNELLTNTICKHIQQQFVSDNLDNSDLVQIIEHLGGVLNIQTISDYAKVTGISYNGAKKFRNVIELFGIKFIIDND